MKQKSNSKWLLTSATTLIVTVILLFPTCGKKELASKDFLVGSFRNEVNGWIYIHVEGEPFQRGYQHGYLLGDEIATKVLPNVKFYIETVLGSSWDTFRDVVTRIHWPKTPDEYQKEIQGIAEGVTAKGHKDVDIIDIAALNNWLQIAWGYLPWSQAKEMAKIELKDLSIGACSAFIATGDATANGEIVMAHNTWIDYVYGIYWNIIIDLTPETGHSIMVQTCPGFIHSGPDWCMNSNGIMVTETTIAGFFGFDPEGIPETVRLRKATQYANSIDEWIDIMVHGANGEYANDWLVGDRKTGEIACLELGIKNHRVWRKTNGYFVGSNIAQDQKLREEETKFPYDDRNTSMASRWARWEQLMKANYGQIDVDLAKKMISDHHDISLGKEQASANTICGHIDLDVRGLPQWECPAYYPCGAIDGKIISSTLNKNWKMWCAFGHPCGLGFDANKFLQQHTEFIDQKPQLADLPSYPWTLFPPK
ncbi:MAG: C45 family peptidase [Acidobacteriota bacterium]|nr:C45 family peptidase [Acidobacteriota bacterium]